MNSALNTLFAWLADCSLKSVRGRQNVPPSDLIHIQAK